jgi:hypothetical protein
MDDIHKLRRGLIVARRSSSYCYIHKQLIVMIELKTHVQLWYGMVWCRHKCTLSPLPSN